MNKTIHYKGRKLETKFYKPITEDERIRIKKEYYKKPLKKDVSNNIIKLNGGGVMKTKINDYYFKDLYSLVKLNHSKWSIDEVLSSRELMGFVFGKIDSNNKVYDPKNKDIKNVETVFRIGSKGIAQKPSLFPIKAINHLLKKYKVNNYHDYSCGWGDRLTGALINNVNYYGTDVNYKLVDRLIEYKDHWNEVTENDSVVDIRKSGSEFFIEEWENLMDFSFSSPPYFDLEDYIIGEQSWSEGVTIEEWVNLYLRETFSNCYMYLKEEGIFAININDTKEHNLKEIAYDLAIEQGFIYKESIELKNINRIKSDSKIFNNNEEIMVFRKGERK